MNFPQSECRNAFKLQDNVAKLLAEFATAKQKKDDLQQQFEAPSGQSCGNTIRQLTQVLSWPGSGHVVMVLVQVCTKRLITAEKLINGLGWDLSNSSGKWNRNDSLGFTHKL